VRDYKSLSHFGKQPLVCPRAARTRGCCPQPWLPPRKRSPHPPLGATPTPSFARHSRAHLRSPCPPITVKNNIERKKNGTHHRAASNSSREGWSSRNVRLVLRARRAAASFSTRAAAAAAASTFPLPISDELPLIPRRRWTRTLWVAPEALWRRGGPSAAQAALRRCAAQRKARRRCSVPASPRALDVGG